MNVVQMLEDAMPKSDDTEFVRQAYLRLLGRAADEEGLKGYVAQLKSGLTRTEMLQVLSGCEEAQRYEARRTALRRAAAPSPLRTNQVMLAPSWGVAPTLQNSMPAGPAPQVDHINALMELEGGLFVKAAYAALLGREADEAGWLNYARKLRDGWSKMSILKGLAQSDEARKAGRTLPGLDHALKRYAKAQRRSWGGWYYRSVLGVESDLPLERQLRAAHLALRRE